MSRDLILSNNNGELNLTTIRGATTITNNTKEEIRYKTLELIDEIVRVNRLEQNEIISMVFTSTKDIDAEYPSKFVRLEREFSKTSYLNVQEMYVQGSLKFCIRVLIFINTKKDNTSDVYLHEAKNLKK